MSVPQSRPPRKGAVCPTCQSHILRDNFKRHFINKHLISKDVQALSCSTCISGAVNPISASDRGPTTTHQPLNTSVPEILKILDEHETSRNQNLLSWIRTRKWYSLDDMAASIPNWKGLSPRLLSAGECWHPRPPTEAEMWKASVTEIQRAKVDEDVPYQVYDSLEQPSSDVAGNVATSLMQIRMRRKEDEDEGQWSELQRNPVTVLNLFPSYLAQRVHIPLRLKQHLEFEDPPPKAANITPKYAFVDVHIDHGMEAISICVGRCRKVWFLWPPTTDNLKEMERLDHRDPDRLIRSYLDDGILLQTDKSTGIHVPSGWLHATFTIEGGFLVGITPVTAESIGLISSCTSSELVSEPGTQPNLKGYIRGLETALRSTKPSVLQDTLDGWQHLGPQLAILRTGKKGLGDNGKALRAIWDEFLLRFSLKLQRRRSEDQVMVLTSESCCNLTDPAFPDHFRAVHMVPVFSHSRSRV